MEESIYEEFGPVLAWTAGILIAGSLSFAAIEAIQGFPNDAIGLLIGLLGPIVALTVWGVYRHSRIRLTSSSLVVGNEAIALSDLDAAFGVRGIEDLDASERFRVELPFPIPEAASVRIPGGAWGRILGTRVVVLRSQTEQKKLAFFTRNQECLVPLLEASLPTAEPRRS